MTLRKKIALFFILLVVIPILIIYSIAILLFNQSNQMNLKSLYANNITAIGLGVDRYFNDALNLSTYPLMEKNLRNFLLVSPDNPAYLSTVQAAVNTLSSMPYGFSNGIRSYTLMSQKGASINTGVDVGIHDDEAEAARALASKPLWSTTTAADANNEKIDYIQLIRLLKNPNSITQPAGFVKICLSKDQLRQSILAGSTNDKTYFYILSKDGEPLLQTTNMDEADGLPTPPAYSQLYQLATNHDTELLDSGFFVSAHQIVQTPFILCSIVKPASFSIIGNTLIAGFSIAAVLMIIFSVILVFVFSKSITAPLARLGKNMESISNEDFSVRGTANGKDEISLLVDRFNHMANRLDLLYNQVYLSKLELKQAQLNALQMQINPHFLYNTLDTIYWMAQMGESAQVSTMVSNLSQMMRFTLSEDNNDEVPLREELSHLNCYIGIQKIRYGEGVTFEIRCNDDLYDCKVLKLLLQPLVENALQHGLKNTQTGKIFIDIFQYQDDKLVYDVKNNGEPIDVEEITQLISQPDEHVRGFALRNIARRIQLKNGSDYCLTYFLEGRFSVFRITQKYQQINERERTDDDKATDRR